jgi:hypothetical protein
MSKFDPYIEEIGKYVVRGCSVREIAELIEYHFNDAVAESALYTFMRSRGLQSTVTQGGTNLEYEAPCCQGCENCLRVLNTNETEVNVCLITKRIVNKSCKTSPDWCVKREKVRQ